MNSMIIEKLKNASVISNTGKVNLENLAEYVLTHDVLVVMYDGTVNNITGTYLRAVIEKWTFQDKAMGEQFITFDFLSEQPVAWAVNDYCIFRGERFVLNYIPSVTQKGRRNAVLDSYKYEGVKLNSLADELTRCQMLDVVLTPGDPDQGTNYTGSSKFDLFCGETIVNGTTRTSVMTLGDRILANLNRMYRDDQEEPLWTIVYGDNTHSEDQMLSFDNQYVSEALAMVKSKFDINYAVRGRTIYIGCELGDVAGVDYGYGPGYPTEAAGGKGLFELKKISDSSQQIVTRLRVLGSPKNLPYRYYNKAYNLPQALFPLNLQLPDTFLPEGTPSDPVGANTKWGHNKQRSSALRAVQGATNDAYIDKGDDASATVEGIREATIRFDGSDSKLKEIYPTIENVTYDELRGSNVPDQEGTTGENAFPNYEADEKVNELLAIGYEYDGDMYDDANIGSGILSDDNTGGSGNVNDISIALRTETMTRVDDYYCGSEHTLFTVSGQTAGKYFFTPVMNKEPYFTYTPLAADDPVGFIIRVKATAGGETTVIAEYKSDFYSGRNALVLPSIPDAFYMDDAKVREIALSGTADITVTFIPCTKVATSLLYRVGARQGSSYTAQYVWSTVANMDSSAMPFHVFVKDMGVDFEAQFNGETPAISMKSGECVGREFQISAVEKGVEYNGKKGYMLTLNRASDSSLNVYFPNSRNTIAADDQFVITGIDMPEAYIKAAELRLLTAATEWFAENGNTHFHYQPAIDDIYLKRNYENMVNAGTPEDSVFWKIYAGYDLTFHPIPDGPSDPEPSAISVTIESVTITMGEGLTRKVDILLNDELKESTLKRVSREVGEISRELEAFGAGMNSLAIQNAVKDYASKRFLSKIENDTAAGDINFQGTILFDKAVYFGKKADGTYAAFVDPEGNINTEKNMQAAGGVSAGGMVSLNQFGAGGGTVNGIKFDPNVAYQENHEYLSDGEDVTLPAYPSLAGYATENYVATYFGANFTQVNIKNTLGISDWALAANKPSYNFSEIGSKPTTIAGYGITDAHITSGVITLGANTITPATLSNGKIPLSQLPDAILGQMIYGGTVNGSGVVTLSQNAKDKWGITSLTLTSTNYADYEGAYFIASADGSSGVPSTLGVLVGDWIVATASNWGKIDNTDAVTGIKFATGDIRIGQVDLTTWLGSSNITTLGTIATGVWHGTAIGDSYISSAATWNAKYAKPSGGIPATDLAQAVQTSLGKADTALQSHQTIYNLIIQKNGTQVGNTYNPATGAQTINITDVASASDLESAVSILSSAIGTVDGKADDNAANIILHDGRIADLESYFDGGIANNATRLSNTSKIGDTNKPVYFTANGVPAAISYEINKSVPSNALFTDQNVSQTATTSNAAYEILFSGSANNTTATEGARKTDTLTYNPSTKELRTGGDIELLGFVEVNRPVNNVYPIGDTFAAFRVFTQSYGQSNIGGVTANGVYFAHVLTGYTDAEMRLKAGSGLSLNTNVMAAGGVSAGGMVDLSLAAGGGGSGTLTQIKINGTALPDVDGVVNIPIADTTQAGAMSTSDRAKLTGIADGANASNVAWSTNKLTKTINGVTSDVFGISDVATALTTAGYKLTDTWTAWAGATSSAAGTAGYMPAPTSAQRNQFLRGDGSWVDLNNYSLPLAASGTRGGVQIGYTTDATNRNYAVQLSSEKMYVNVPWTDTTYESKAAASGGTAVSLVTTGEKYNWNTAYGWGDHSQAGYITGNQTITLSGDVSGSGATAITVSIGTGKVTNAMLAGSIANVKLVNSKITIAGREVSLGDSISTANLRSDLGLGLSAYTGYDTVVTKDSDNLITSGAVYNAIDNLPEPMIMKGTLGTNGTINSLPTASASNEGFTYKVITAGTYASQVAKVGDVFVSYNPSGSTYDWLLIPAGDTDSDTWRNIKVNDTELLGTALSSGAVNFKNGGNITLTGSGNNITLGVKDGYSIPTTLKQDNWDTAFTNNHTHSNKSVLDGISSDDVTHWGTAYTNSHTHSNKAVLDNITLGKLSNWDDAYGWGDHAQAGYAMASSLADYLPLTGGTLNDNATDYPLTLCAGNANYAGSYVKFAKSGGTLLGYLGCHATDGPVFYDTSRHKMWHDGNDGSGSGLDADLLDGHHFSEISDSINVLSSSIGQVSAMAQENADNITSLGTRTSNLESYFDAGIAKNALRLSNTSAIGTTTKPVYFTANGVPSACSDYAGGTAVTLNGSSKAASTASFYAPTAGGTAGYTLIGNGTTSAPIWSSLLFFDTTNSRIGIGTTSPAYKLAVNGTFYASGNSNIGGTLGVTGATTLSSTLGVSGATTLSSTLNVTGASTLGGKLTVNNDIETNKGWVKINNLTGDEFAAYRVFHSDYGSSSLGGVTATGVYFDHQRTGYSDAVMRLMAGTGLTVNQNVQAAGGISAGGMVDLSVIAGQAQYVTSMGFSNNALTWALGGEAQTPITIGYATYAASAGAVAWANVSGKPEIPTDSTVSGWGYQKAMTIYSTGATSAYTLRTDAQPTYDVISVSSGGTITISAPSFTDDTPMGVIHTLRIIRGSGSSGTVILPKSSGTALSVIRPANSITINASTTTYLRYFFTKTYVQQAYLWQYQVHFIDYQHDFISSAN